MKNNSYFYLLGLICGKGYIYKKSLQIAIEFAHSNESIDGIAHCQKCGFLATKAPSGDFLICKNPNCRVTVPKNTKKRYEQSHSTKNSVRVVIAPFICADSRIKSAISGSKSITMLILDFKSEPEIFERLLADAGEGTDFSNLRIPKRVWASKFDESLEFLNGLLDSTGYANAGGWIPRDGATGTGRMRLYIQIVRNWHLCAEIDVFLRDKLKRPVQTIDWGHPNIRDSNLQDFRSNRETAWTREHQIKFFPEYYSDITFRLTHKAQMFGELLEHNLGAGFQSDKGWFPPGKIQDGRRKARHPGEDDPRLPIEVRRHFDAFWQVNLALGSSSFRGILDSSPNPETYALTGDVNDTRDAGVLFSHLHSVWSNLALKLSPIREKATLRVGRTSQVRELERATYEPLVKILKGELESEYGPDVVAFDTSSGNLNSFIARLDSDKVQKLAEWDSFDIRPDVVGFAVSESRPVFIESKIDLLTLKHLGQLLGYCAAANPKRAILVSTKAMSESLTRAILRNPTLLEYGDVGTVEIGQLEGSQIRYWGSKIDRD